jgi:hypothetical protein
MNPSDWSEKTRVARFLSYGIAPHSPTLHPIRLPPGPDLIDVSKALDPNGNHDEFVVWVSASGDGRVGRVRFLVARRHDLRYDLDGCFLSPGPTGAGRDSLRATGTVS